jgi:hypothetical protein
MRRKFSSREDWEQNQRARCWEWAWENTPRNLSNYFTEAQVADAVSKLRECWKKLGRQLRVTTDEQERFNIWVRKATGRGK